ncbi:hypothetical protein ACLOJK_033958 [Asimina triloba]
MATANPFYLLGADDNDDPSQLIVAAQQQQQQKDVAPANKMAALAKKAPLQPTQAKLPSKPLPPAQAVRVAKNEVGSGRGAGRGGGHRGHEFYRDSGNNENSFNNEVASSVAGDEDSMKRSERGSGSYGGFRGSFRGGRRGALNNGGMRERDQLRRQFERHSGIERGNWIKRDGSGAGHWGTPTDDIAQVAEESATTNDKSSENQLGEVDTAGANKEATANEPEGKEPEDKENAEETYFTDGDVVAYSADSSEEWFVKFKEMTLDEYEKVLEEKRKALKASKTEERKVDPKEFEYMQQLSSKKDNDDVFIKLGSEKDKRKDIADKEEKAKKAVSMSRFLKPAEGTKYYGGRGRGRGDLGFRGGFGGSNMMSNVAAPSIEDRGQFPILGAN